MPTRRAARGTSRSLPELPIQYGDFAEWQREWLTGDVLDRPSRLLAAISSRRRSRCWTCRPIGRVRRYRRSAAHPCALRSTRATTAALAAGWRARKGATLFMALLAAFNALLHPLHRSGGRHRRLADRQPRPARARAADRVLREHAGAAQPAVGRR